MKDFRAGGGVRGSAVSAQSVPPLTAFGAAIAVAVLLIVLPFGTMRASNARHAAVSRADVVLDEIAAKQSEALKAIVAMQGDIATVRTRIAQLKTATRQDETLIAAREIAEKGKINKVRTSADATERNLDEKVKTLEAETRATFKDLKSQLDIRKNRFLVKWHGDEGVKTSKRMTTEVEALNFFNQVGEFAKKMFMFDGQRWLTLREFGGDNWLSMIKDDGTLQDGDGKPTKPPKTPKPAA
jgi:hypothetical protein